MGGFDGLVHHVVQIQRASKQAVVVGRQAPHQPGQANLDGREIAAEVIVHFARQVQALAFLDRFHVRGQRAELRLGMPDFSFGQLAVRDIQQDAVPDGAVRCVALADTDIHPLDVFPGFHPDAAFPVEGHVPAARLVPFGQVIGLVFFHDQLEKALGVGDQGRGLDAEQLGRLLADIAQRGAAIRFTQRLVGHAGDMRDDGTQIHAGMIRCRWGGFMHAEVGCGPDENRFACSN